MLKIGRLSNLLNLLDDVYARICKSELFVSERNVIYFDDTFNEWTALKLTSSVHFDSRTLQGLVLCDVKTFMPVFVIRTGRYEQKLAIVNRDQYYLYEGLTQSFIPKKEELTPTMILMDEEEILKALCMED